MNIDCEASGAQHLVRPRTVPILLLVQQWAAEQHTLINTRLILFVLQCVQSIYCTRGHGEFKAVCLKDIFAMITGLEEFHARYKQSLQSTASDLTEFMSLFSRLEELFSTGDENSLALLERSNGIFGGFLRHCVLEYKQLTFTQVHLLHQRWSSFMNDSDNWVLPLSIGVPNQQKDNRRKLADSKLCQDFSTALKILTLSHPNSESNGTKVVDVADKALEMASLLSHFNHKHESSLALNEAIRLAQMSDNPMVLEYSLALLQRIQQAQSHDQSHDTTAMMEQFVKNAEHLKQPLLISTGKLQMAKAQLKKAIQPRKVLRTIQTAQFDVFQSYEKKNNKAAIRSASLLLHSTVYRQYGLSQLSLLPLQLLCHKMPPKSYMEPQMEVFVKAIATLAKSLEEDGRIRQARSLTNATLSHIPSMSNSHTKRYLVIYSAELAAVEAFHRSDYSALSLEISKLQTYDALLAMYWRAVMLKGLRNFKLAMNTSECLMNELHKMHSKGGKSVESIKLEARVLLLQTGLLQCEQQTSAAIMRALECISLCNEHHLYMLATKAKLLLAKSQLSISSMDQCELTLFECFPSILSHGSREDKAQLYLLLAQLELFKEVTQTNGQEKGPHPEAAQTALKYLSQAIDELQHYTHPPPLYQSILILKANIHHRLGNITERNQSAVMVESIRSKTVS